MNLGFLKNFYKWYQQIALAKENSPSLIPPQRHSERRNHRSLKNQREIYPHMYNMLKVNLWKYVQ